MFDTTSLPVSGAVLVAIALYVGASLYAGQVVAVRTIERSDWHQRCEAGIRAEIEARKPPKRVIPKTDCRSVFGWLHPDIDKLCWRYGNPDLSGPAGQAKRETDRLRREFEERQLALTASRAGTRCSCAANVYARESLVPLGIYAGTARMISLPRVTGMQNELHRALHGPSCSKAPEATP